MLCRKGRRALHVLTRRTDLLRPLRLGGGGEQPPLRRATPGGGGGSGGGVRHESNQGANRVQARTGVTRRADLLRPWGVVGWAASPRRATLPHTNCSNGSLSKMALMNGDLVACTSDTTTDLPFSLLYISLFSLLWTKQHLDTILGICTVSAVAAGSPY